MDPDCSPFLKCQYGRVRSLNENEATVRLNTTSTNNNFQYTTRTHNPNDSLFSSSVLYYYDDNKIEVSYFDSHHHHHVEDGWRMETSIDVTSDDEWKQITRQLFREIHNYDGSEHMEEIELLCCKSSLDSMESVNSSSSSSQSSLYSFSTAPFQDIPDNNPKRKRGSKRRTDENTFNSIPPLSVIVLYNNPKEQEFVSCSQLLHENAYNMKQKLHKVVRSSDESISTCYSIETISICSNCSSSPELASSISSSMICDLHDDRSNDYNNSNSIHHHLGSKKTYKKWPYVGISSIFPHDSASKSPKDDGNVLCSSSTTNVLGTTGNGRNGLFQFMYKPSKTKDTMKE